MLFPLRVRANFNDDYANTARNYGDRVREKAGDGINPIALWDVEIFCSNNLQDRELQDFLDYHGGHRPFQWQSPRDDNPQNYVLVGGVASNSKSGGDDYYYYRRAKFRRAYELNVPPLLTLTAIDDGWTITRTGDAITPLTVNYSITVTPSVGVSVTSSGSVIIPSGQHSVTISSVGTSLGTETLALLNGGYELSSPSFATITTIGNTLPAVSLTLNNPSIAEGSNASYTFSRTGATTAPLTVNFSVGGTATLNTDYTATGATTFSSSSGSVVIPSGQSSRTIAIAVADDAIAENNETVSLTLTANPGYTIDTPGSVTLTITDNDLPTITLSVSPSSVSEGSTATYTFTRIGVNSSPLTVSFTVGGTATLNTDYTVAGADSFTNSSGSITIAAGQSTKNITITTATDSLAEGAETLQLSLASSPSYDISTTGAVTLTINNNPNNVVTLAVSPSSVLEGTGTSNTATYTFSRTGETTNAITINFSVGGTATLNTDYTVSGAATYTNTSGTINIASGQSSATLTINTNPDTTSEQNETVVLTLTNGVGYSVGTSSGVTLTITNDDIPTITLTVSPSTINEGNTTSNSAIYTFTRSGTNTGNLLINFGVGGTATFSTDYNINGATSYSNSNGSIVIPNGQSSATLTITTAPDTTSEQNETVVLTLSPSGNYNIGTSSGVSLTLANDDLPSITLSASPTSINEIGGTATYTFTRSGNITNPLTVNFTVGGSATFNTDYTQSGATSFTSSSGSINILAGQSTATLIITSISDAIAEGNETVVLTLSANINYAIGTSSGVSVDIIDSVPAISLSLSTNSVTEGNSSGNSATYTFTRSIVTASPLTVNFTVGGSAVFSTDYTQSGANTFTSTIGSVIIPANQASASITITTVPDTAIESDETLSFTLSADSNYSITTTGAVGLTITNDDFIPNISLSLSTSNVLEGNSTGNSAVYTFTRSFSTASPLTVNFSVGGTATLASDYTQSGADTFTSTIGSVIIPANQTSATVTINTVPDTTVESDETLSLTLTTDSSYSITTTGAVTLTITNDDSISINYSNFTGATGLSFNSVAAINGSVLRLTPDNSSLATSVWFSNKASLNSSTAFSCQFQFRITGSQGTGGADGLAFVLQNHSTGLNARGNGGGDIGYSPTITNSLAVCFLTYLSSSLQLKSGGNTTITTVNSPFVLNNGSTYTVWVDYDKPTNNIKVFLNNSATKPSSPVINATANITTLVGNSGYFGFTAGTGGAWNIHDILSWSLSGNVLFS